MSTPKTHQGTIPWTSRHDAAPDPEQRALFWTLHLMVNWQFVPDGFHRPAMRFLWATAFATMYMGMDQSIVSFRADGCLLAPGVNVLVRLSFFFLSWITCA